MISSPAIKKLKYTHTFKSYLHLYNSTHVFSIVVLGGPSDICKEEKLLPFHCVLFVHNTRWKKGACDLCSSSYIHCLMTKSRKMTMPLSDIIQTTEENVTDVFVFCAFIAWQLLRSSACRWPKSWHLRDWKFNCWIPCKLNCV